MSWTLSYAGTALLLEEWGLLEASLNLSSLADDTFTCQSVPLDDDAAGPLFQHGEAIALYSGANCVFRGTLQDVSPSFVGRKWRWSYTFYGPWWGLNHTMAQQLWTVIDGDAGTEVSANKSRILCGARNGGSIKTGEMIREALAYGRDVCGLGFDFDPGAIPVGMEVPTWTDSDVTLAELIQHICAWHPRAISWWDYSSEPPIFNLRLNTGGSGSVDFMDPTLTAIAALRARYDLVLPGVIIRFERTISRPTVKILKDNGEYDYVLASVAEKYGKTPLGEGPDRVFEYITTSKWPEDVDETLPGILIYSVAWSESFAPPADVARHIFEEAEALRMEGKIVLTGAECDFRQWIGSQTQLSGLPGAWPEALCRCEGVTYDIDEGRTTVSIGPGGRLGVSSWIDLLNMRRKAAPASSQLISAQSSLPGTGDGNALPPGYAEKHFRFLDGTAIASRYFLVREVN